MQLMSTGYACKTPNCHYWLLHKPPLFKLLNSINLNLNQSDITYPLCIVSVMYAYCIFAYPLWCNISLLQIPRGCLQQCMVYTHLIGVPASTLNYTRLEPLSLVGLFPVSPVQLAGNLPVFLNTTLLLETKRAAHSISYIWHHFTLILGRGETQPLSMYF